MVRLWSCLLSTIDVAIDALAADFFLSREKRRLPETRINQER
jgi:hypothetical protein